MATAHDRLVDCQFGAQAQAYVASDVHAAGPDLDRIGTIAATMPTAHALDLGCGGGHVAYRLAPHVADVIACDLSPGMLAAVEQEAGRRGFANVQTEQARAEALPFDDGQFDLVVSRFSAHHWRGWDAGLREARRVTRSAGRVVFVDTVAPADAVADTWLQSIELLRDPGHVRNRRIDEWVAGLERAGFAVERVGRHVLPLDFTTWVERMRTPAAGIAALRALQAVAPAEVRDALGFAADGSFAIDVATIEARAA